MHIRHPQPRRQVGFTLIELLVVIAIIAILAAILFPVFAKAREKARQTQCLNNQRQLATAMLMYAQDHEEILPAVASVWGDTGLEAKIRICPTAGQKVTNGYAYNPNCAEKALGEIPNPSLTWLTVDGVNGAFEYRHSKKAIKSYADGHTALVDPPSIVTPVTATSKSGTWVTRGTPAQTFDGVGLATPLATNDRAPSNWPVHTITHGTTNNYWLISMNGTSDWIAYDLGATRNLSGMCYWNYWENATWRRGIKDVVIKTSTDSTDGSNGTWNDLVGGPILFTEGAHAQPFTWPETTARWVRFSNFTAYGDMPGVGEVRFIQTPY
jgi:prepilin-type N-terminal cleavage/methylation domain-containing protein